MSGFNRYAYVKWFYNINGILDYFANEPDFSELGHSWASYADAGVLQAINDGWRMYEKQLPIGFAGGEWAEFFRMVKDEDERYSEDQIRSQWGIAEQSGVDYGVAIAEKFIDPDDPRVQGKIEYFVRWGDTYRSMVKNEVWNTAPLIFDKPLDPRTRFSQRFVYFFSDWGITTSYNMAYPRYSDPMLFP